MYSGPYNNPAYPPSNPYGPPGGYGAPGFGAPSYGAPGYGAPPSGYGAPGGYGVPPVPTGYNSDPYGMMPPGGGGYGAPPPMGGYGMNPPGMNPPGMMAPGGGGYGAPSYNAPGHSNYPPTGYGGGYGNVPPVGGGYASPPMGHPGAYPPAAPTGYNVPPVAAGGYPGGAHPPPGGYASTVTSTSMTTPVVAQTTTTTTTGMIPVIYMPIYTYPHSDPHTDATRLRKAMKGLGTDDSVLISIMTNRSKHQLQLIQEAYLREFKKSLEKDIIGDTSGNYQTLLCDLLRPVLAYKIESIKKAVRGLGTRESILIDVITQSSNAEIAQMKSQYPDIERDVSKDTSGNFRKVLLELLKGNRQETNVIDDSKAQAVAGELYKAGEMRLGTNDSKFVDIMTTYSPYFLDRVNLHYTRMYGNSLYKAIEKETSGDYCLALIACAKPPDAYFADRLKRATRGLGTDDWGLIYVFALHDKAQLKHISKVYTDRGHGILPSDVERDTSGNYRKSLISLLA